MDRYKKFIIAYIVGVSCIFSSLAFICDFLIFHSDTAANKIYLLLNKKGVDILYFGDSVIKAHSDCEIRIDGMDELLKKETGYEVLSVNGNNYSPIIYKDYAKLISKARYSPKVVIIPINLRSFSDQWFKNPAAQMKIKQLYINLLAGQGFDLKEYFAYRYLNKEGEEMKKWEETDIVYEEMHLGKISDIGKKVRIPENIDCIEGSYDYSKELATLFELHYMNSINKDHAMFGYLRETFEEIRRRKINILVYITPINIEDGKKYSVPVFEKRVNHNLNEIRVFLNSNRISYLDLSMSLGSSYFVDKKLSCEHMSFEGKVIVVRALKERIAELMGK